MSARRPQARVEDYTAAFLLTSGIVVFMALFTLAATLGFAAVLVATALAESLLRAGRAVRRRWR